MSFRRCVAAVLVTVLSTLQLPAAAAGERPSSLADRHAVRDYLLSRGAPEDQAAARVLALSDQEARELARQLDEAPAGGNIEAALKGVFFLALVTVYLVVKAVESVVKAVQDEAPARAPAAESPFPR